MQYFSNIGPQYKQNWFVSGSGSEYRTRTTLADDPKPLLSEF